jgi:L-ascorbate metabolism protein UlaG (beta-lactamase superfamily)
VSDDSSGYQEGSSVDARRLVPIHWDGFAGNTVPFETAVAAAGGRMDVVVPSRFETIDLSAR